VDDMTVIVGTHPAPAPSALGMSLASRDDVARQLWDLLYAQLAGWCAALVGDRDAAHDIASEAFTRLLAKWIGVRDPRGFLYVTATNLARDRWRREQRDRRLNARLTVLTVVGLAVGLMVGLEVAWWALIGVAGAQLVLAAVAARQLVRR